MARRQEPESWQRWAPQQSWQPLPGAFGVDHAFTITPLISIPAPQYPVHHGFVYGEYDTAEVTNSVVSTKQFLAERAMLDMSSVSVHSVHELPQETNPLPSKQGSMSPVIKTESQSPERLRDGATPANTADSQNPNVVFATGIDRLMKIIQQKNDGSEGNAPASQARPRPRANNSNPGGSASRKKSKANASVGEPTNKPHACQRRECDKRFSQITHLHIHDRAHTGERPHVRIPCTGCPRCD